MQWANRKTFSMLVPIMGVGMLIPYIAGMLSGRARMLVHYSGLATGLFFTLCLLMTPLYIIWGIRGGQGFKKPFGLFAFVYSVLHAFAYLVYKEFDFAAFVENEFVITGVLAMLVMLPLALTSTPWAMRKLGKNWKRMQRLTYVAAVLFAAHMFFTDHISMLRYTVGLLILVLLAIRLSPLRKSLIQRHIGSRRRVLDSR